jgi:hypothetical protein
MGMTQCLQQVFWIDLQPLSVVGHCEIVHGIEKMNDILLNYISNQQTLRNEAIMLLVGTNTLKLGIFMILWRTRDTPVPQTQHRPIAYVMKKVASCRSVMKT